MLKKTKIVATLGPSTCNSDKIRDMILAGVSVFRLNFSHGTHEFHIDTAAMIRSVEKDLGANVAIMMDLQGPKIRVGLFDNGFATLQPGQQFVFDKNREFGSSKRVYVPNDELFQAIKKGNRVLIDDGKIEMRVSDRKRDTIVLDVINGGVISNKKGINVPNIVLPINAITEKDKDDISIAREVTADYVAISFVQRASDLVLARRIANDVKPNLKIVAKIEKQSAIDDIDGILDQCDGVMVARGDLAVEVPFEMVPTIQKTIISKAVASKKPVIVATQMLESMTKCCTPTRAEITDVANAIFDNTDAIMLSAESASGDYPIESVKTMTRIASYNEAYKPVYLGTCGSIAKFVFDVALERKIEKTFVFCDNNAVLLDISSARPKTEIIANVFDEDIYKYSCLLYGVRANMCSRIYNFGQIAKIVQEECLHDGESVLSEDSGDKDVLVVVSIGGHDTSHVCKVSDIGSSIF